MPDPIPPPKVKTPRTPRTPREAREAAREARREWKAMVTQAIDKIQLQQAASLEKLGSVADALDEAIDLLRVRHLAKRVDKLDGKAGRLARDRLLQAFALLSRISKILV